MKHSTFFCKEFSITQNSDVLKLGTDAILLGCFTNFDNPKQILDIGTGTGILTLMLAQKYDANCIAIDISQESYTCALQNFKKSKWAHSIECHHISLQEFCKTSHIVFDGIVCNPPFFTHALQSNTTSKNIARHTIALSPFDLFSGSQLLISSHGILSIILPLSEKQYFCEHAIRNNFHIIKEIEISPFTHTPANRIILHFSKTWQPCSRAHISIRNTDKTYSEEYKELTKNYIIKL